MSSTLLSKLIELSSMYCTERKKKHNKIDFDSIVFTEKHSYLSGLRHSKHGGFYQAESSMVLFKSAEQYVADDNRKIIQNSTWD